MQRELSKSSEFEQWKRQLGLSADERGIIRCRGRIDNANVPHTAKFPVLISSEHHITTLIIKECHNKVGHNGVKETLVQLRSRFWVIRGRQVVRKTIFLCAVSQGFEGRPYASLTPAPLSTFRVANDPAFCNLQYFSKSLFYQYQSLYIAPTVNEFWEHEKKELWDARDGKEVILNGDGRNDSPGHSAQYCTYSLADMADNAIVQVNIVDVREAAGKSNNMEGIGF